MTADSGRLTEHRIDGVRDFDAAQTFECGQCFRWTREYNGSYTGVVRGYFANISYNNEEDAVIIWSDYMPKSERLRDRFWRDYLDLDRDYAAIKRTLSENDPVMEAAIEAGRGIRILNQEPWETLISFLISQNNNIPRISGCIETLCGAFGTKIGRFEDRDFFAFPTVKQLAERGERELDICKLGYRTRYLAETARQVDIDGGSLLATGEKIETEKIESYLRSLSGVGLKVAHCVMLFSMKKTELFPIDVWMRRVMHKLYGMEEDDEAAMRAFARERFREYGGVAQQYLFHYIRTESIQ
ncbi:MAG: 8-oxoguanine DNA glycosylase [Clostridiales Family XIII bacterium]|jgi:N-glycosylase/DNA lyase|nr:8-oxoguanine DNA glycosylase [Clostridiales Family XIII bacterium]